ncbi:MAG: hypothetical protein E7460_03385 [Ruminococcaceae bacterium]|nr:hypothetical protein [Oscillospiraceae bacterium]
MVCYNDVQNPGEVAAFGQGENLVFRDAHDAVFDLYQCTSAPGEPFRRVPAEVADNTNEGVAWLARHTSGIRLRIKTDSARIALKADLGGIDLMYHMPITGSAGFDIFLWEKGKQSFVAGLAPACVCKEICGIHDFGEKKVRDIVINFPLYNCVKSLSVGLEADAQVLAPAKYRPIAPVLYYGSSITQGGCASRPGNAYQSMISRRFDLDFINMGFSGSARGEDIMTDWLISFEPSVFVCDYDHNAPDAEHLEKTHYRLYSKYRAAHPETPIIFVTKPDFDSDPDGNDRRRAVIRATYEKALAEGDTRVTFIDGETLFGDEDRGACTVDGCHPTDLGFWRMSRVIGDAVGKALRIL